MGRNCLICGKPTAHKVSFTDHAIGKRFNIHFDLCEACKLEKNCFTCRYSQAWYLRYKGKCDVSFPLFLIAERLEDESGTPDRAFLNEVIATYSLEESIAPTMKVSEFLQLVKHKLQAEVMKKTPHCSLYKTKNIGEYFTCYWNQKPCRRHKRGDATKNEFDEYNSPY